MLYACKGAHHRDRRFTTISMAHTPSQRTERERERGKEKEGERKEKEGGEIIEREREYLFLKGMTVALAPFSYLVSK